MRTVAQLLAESTRRLDLDAVAVDFYPRLFARAPHLQALFPADLHVQRRHFTAALRTLVDGYTEPASLIPSLRALGARHVGYGAQPGHYPIVGDVLLASLAHVVAEDWCDDYTQAWTQAFGVVATHMLAGAGQTPAPNNAPPRHRQRRLTRIF